VGVKRPYRAAVDVTDNGPVRVLTFDRPEKLNALDSCLADRATAALGEAEGDASVGAVVLTGSGRAFCAGVDLDHLAAMGAGEESTSHTLAFNQAIRNFAKPLIAAVNGMAVGVGCTMCLHVDLVVAGASARFRTPFTKIGVAPEIGSSWLLPQQIGHQRASWMLLSSEWIDAETAVSWGLAFERVDDDLLIERATERAATIAANGPAAVAAAKRTVQAWRTPAIEAAEEIENAEFRTLLGR
jgi:enoyl-CoA hydratase/carnithine racemase